VHVALLLGSCALLPILPNPVWRPTQAGDPTARILLLLTATIGLPYFLLSSTSPLLQAWLVRRTVPYRLFALSNFGSMLALVSFPFLVEPILTTQQQAYSWSGGYVVFALLCVYTAFASSRAEIKTAVVAREPQSLPESQLDAAPGIFQLVFWVLLAACASTLLVSVTNHMSQNVAPIPLLWVLPLALYLLSFILAFEGDRIYQRPVFIPLLIPALSSMAYMIYASGRNLDVKWAIPGFAAGLFACCMFCHGELARRRPSPHYLTLFYLMVSFGGALGGVFVAVVAPRVFDSYRELPLALIMCGLLAIIASWEMRLRPAFQSAFGVFFAFLITALAAYFVAQDRALFKNAVLRARNFYGPLEVRDDVVSKDYGKRTLVHGTIAHGSQLLDPGLRYVTTSYYTNPSGVGRAMSAVQATGPMRAGIIGLGAGVLSNYGREGDYIRIYEINPLVERIAQTLFTFFTHSQANKAIVMGDARLTLERQLRESGSQNYDILAVDAFSSDAIPVHLLTREAFRLYSQHLKPDGVLAVHISNSYLDLKLVVAQGMAEIGGYGRLVDNDGGEQPYYSASEWAIVSPKEKFFDTKFFAGDGNTTIKPLAPKPGFRAWTDDFSNIVTIIK